MAAVVALEGLGVVANVIGIYSFIAGLFSDADSPNGNVRVCAGLNGAQLDGGEGKIATIKLFNENAELKQTLDGHDVPDGGFYDWGYKEGDNQQLPWMIIANSNDAVCVSYMTMTWPDGSKYAWLGDWGWVCGLAWTYGNVFVDNNNYKPRCTWLDKDHTNEGSHPRPEALWIHFPTFTDRSRQGKAATSICGDGFRAKENLGDPQYIFRRRKRSETRLIVSSEPTHNATELCLSPTSWGPDFVSLYEKVFCDMDTREILPLCDDTRIEDCYAIPEEGTLARRGTGPLKKYSDVIRWT